MTDIVGRFVPARSDADEIERLRDLVVLKQTTIENLNERLAEAERLLREARRKIRDIDSMSVSQFIDEGIGTSGFDLLTGIGAILNEKGP